MNKVAVANWSALKDRAPSYALVGNVDLVVIRYGDQVSVMYGRCLHRGALLADGHVDGDNLICGLHDWDYRIDTGISEYNNEEVLPKFGSWIDGGNVLVDADEIAAWEKDHPQPSATAISASMPRCMPIRSSRTSSRSSTTPPMACARPATTGLSRPWACRGRSCRRGTTSSS